MLPYIIYWVITLLIVIAVGILTRIVFKKRKTTSIRFIRGFLQLVVIVIALFIFLNKFDDTKAVSQTILKGGTLAIAILTFASQKVLNNVIAGIMLAATKPFDIGDKITILNGSFTVTTGVVVDMTTRHTAVRMADGRVTLVPNGVIDNCSVINENYYDDNGYPFSILCAYDSDVKKAMEIMNRLIVENSLTLNDDITYKTGLTCSELTKDGYELKALVWTNDISDNFKACSELRLDIIEAWKAEGINLPYAK